MNKKKTTKQVQLSREVLYCRASVTRVLARLEKLERNIEFGAIERLEKIQRNRRIVS